MDYSPWVAKSDKTERSSLLLHSGHQYMGIVCYKLQQLLKVLLIAFINTLGAQCELSYNTQHLWGTHYCHPHFTDDGKWDLESLRSLFNHMSVKRWSLSLWFWLYELCTLSLFSLSSNLRSKKPSASFFPRHKDAFWKWQTVWYWESKFILSCSLYSASSLQQPSSLLWSQAHSRVSTPSPSSRIKICLFSAPFLPSFSVP